MIRIKHLLIIILLLTSAHAFCQSLLTYHVVGKVTFYNDKGVSRPLVLNTKVSQDTKISVPYGGKVELLNEATSQRITIKSAGSGTIIALSKANGNSVTELSRKYVEYVKKQLTNKGLVSQERYTDFATVTREKETYDGNKPKGNSLADRFNNFKKQTETKFLTFRQECNRQYTDFVRQAWEKMGAEPAVERPQEPEVKPVVYEDTVSTDRINFFGRKLVQSVVARFKPVRTVREQPKPVEPIKEVEMSKEEEEFCSMPFIFFGSEMTVRLDETKRLDVGRITPNRIADILLHLSGTTYDNLLYDCIALRKEHNLCDWAYLLMLKEITDQFCGTDTNESVVLLGYLYYQSGYKVRFAYNDDNRLFLLVASDHTIYGKFSYRLDGEKFYPVQEVKEDLYISNARFPKEQSLSLRIDQPMEFDDVDSDYRTITSNKYPDVTFNVSVNRCLIDFYNTYPASYINGDQFSRWVLYAETPMDNRVKEQIYPVLRSRLEGLSELEAVSRLLNLIQTGLEYEYDDVVWGGDRAFFAEESLYYPYCDCEDRSILLTRLIRDLLGLECVLVYYPGHLASAVHFTEQVPGDYYELDGKEFTVCDPTFINAPVGMQMSVSELGATLIPIK